MKINKTALTIASILFFVVAIGMGTYLTLQRQQSESYAGRVNQNYPSLSLSTAENRLPLDTTFDVLVGIDSKAESINGVDLKINYDSTKLEALSVTPFGDFMPTTLIPGNIDSSANPGLASIVLGCLPTIDQNCPKTGIGVLAKVTFKIKATGRSKIVFNQKTAISVAGGTTSKIGRVGSLQINGTSR